ncbi:hypothetical protein PV326_003353 [Microctonus aethiopoides]|nr:hypothetical protein PV326_003353 [Microctonus aethiopoides]
MSICSDGIIPSSKPSPKTNAERQCETPILTTPLTQLSPDAGSTIKQHEAVTVYNSVNKKVRDVIGFLHEALFAYTKGGLKLLKKRYHELPLILGGDFNIKFYTDKELRCVQFLKKKLNLDFVSGNTLRTTRHAANILVKQADNESDGLIIETTVKPLQYYTKNFQKGETTVFETLEKYNDIIGRVGICKKIDFFLHVTITDGI